MRWSPTISSTARSTCRCTRALPRQQVDQRGQLAVDPDRGPVLVGVQPPQHAVPLQHLLASADALGADRQLEPVAEILLRQLDRIVRAVAQVVVDRPQQLAAGVRVLNEELLHVAVGVGEQHQAEGGQSIAAGSPGLLIIGLQRARQVKVDHEPQVRLVDAHPKGVGGDDRVQLAGHEVLLHLLPLFGEQPAVVESDAAVGTLVGQQLGNLLAGLASGRVDDAAAGRPVEHVQQPRLLVAGAADVAPPPGAGWAARTR